MDAFACVHPYRLSHYFHLTTCSLCIHISHTPMLVIYNKGTDHWAGQFFSPIAYSNKSCVWECGSWAYRPAGTPIKVCWRHCSMSPFWGRHELARSLGIDPKWESIAGYQRETSIVHWSASMFVSLSLAGSSNSQIPPLAIWHSPVSSGKTPDLLCELGSFNLPNLEGNKARPSSDFCHPGSIQKYLFPLVNRQVCLQAECD